MARFYKHVGEHNGKRIVIVQRSLPGEDHMAAVIYINNLPTAYQEEINRLLESPKGQESNEFMYAMMDYKLASGEPMIPVLVREGFIKKVQTALIKVTPNSSSVIRLDELNSLLKKAGEGEEAIRKLEEMDRAQGRHDPIKKNAPMNIPSAAPAAPASGLLDDERLAINYKSQATRMRNEAAGLLAEATRLETEAAHLLGQPSAQPSSTANVNIVTEKKKRGRPKKVNA